MDKIIVRYKDDYYTFEKPEWQCSYCLDEMFDYLLTTIKERVTLMGSKDGFTITIERGGEK